LFRQHAVDMIIHNKICRWPDASIRPLGTLYSDHIRTRMSSCHELPEALCRKCLVVIPAHNEAESIQQVVRSVEAVCGLDVLVVDDASTDGTGTLGRQAGAEALFLAMNMGAWTATQTGFRYALANGYETVVTMDADGQHFAETIPTLLDTLYQSSSDVVIGANPERATRCRRFSWSFFRLLTPIAINDFTSGLKAYNRTAMELLLRQKAHLFDYQDLGTLLLMHRFGLKVIEAAVPMQKRLHGQSRVFPNWWAVIRYMLLSTALCNSKFRHLEGRHKNKQRKP